jgi:hypothetical protein
MSLPFPPELWQKLCHFLLTNETCQVIIHQHQGRICKIDLGVAKETVWSRKGTTEKSHAMTERESS